MQLQIVVTKGDGAAADIVVTKGIISVKVSALDHRNGSDVLITHDTSEPGVNCTWFLLSLTTQNEQ